MNLSLNRKVRCRIPHFDKSSSLPRLSPHSVLAAVSSRYSQGKRQSYSCITNPFATIAMQLPTISFDLHASSTPIAFNLNQDQILNKKNIIYNWTYYCMIGRIIYQPSSLKRVYSLNKLKFNQWYSSHLLILSKTLELIDVNSFQ